MTSEPKPEEAVVAEFQRLLAKVGVLARAEGAEAEREQGTERVRRAVQNERKRYLEILAKTANRTTVAEVSTRKYLTECRDAVCQPEPPPPAEEPMTIAKILAKIRGGYPDWRHGPDCEKNLILLVKAQARRDADLANCNCGYCRWAILKAAGLE